MKNIIKKETTNIDIEKSNKSAYKISRAIVMALTVALVLTIGCSAAGVDDTLKNTMNFILSIVRILGFGLTIFGIIKLVTAFTAHDSNQKLEGLMAAASGVCVFFLKEILTTIGVSL